MTETPPAIWLAGYLNRSSADIVEMAHLFQAEVIVDICNLSDESQNNLDRCQNLRDMLNAQGIEFHLAGRQLGVHPTVPDHSIHIGLDSLMRGFADYMRTDRFKQGIRQLVSMAKTKRTIVISANDDNNVNSRTLLADYLFLVENFSVFHIVSGEGIHQHRPTQSARVDLDGIVYDRTETNRLYYH